MKIFNELFVSEEEGKKTAKETKAIVEQEKKIKSLKKSIAKKPVEYWLVKRQGILTEDLCQVSKWNAEFFIKEHLKKIVSNFEEKMNNPILFGREMKKIDKRIKELKRLQKK